MERSTLLRSTPIRSVSRRIAQVASDHSSFSLPTSRYITPLAKQSSREMTPLAHFGTLPNQRSGLSSPLLRRRRASILASNSSPLRYPLRCRSRKKSSAETEPFRLLQFRQAATTFRKLLSPSAREATCSITYWRNPPTEGNRSTDCLLFLGWIDDSRVR